MRFYCIATAVFLLTASATIFAQQEHGKEATSSMLEEVTGNDDNRIQQLQEGRTAAAPDNYGSSYFTNGLGHNDIPLNGPERLLPFSFSNWLRSFQTSHPITEVAAEPNRNQQEEEMAAKEQEASAPAINPPLPQSHQTVQQVEEAAQPAQPALTPITEQQQQQQEATVAPAPAPAPAARPVPNEQQPHIENQLTSPTETQQEQQADNNSPNVNSRQIEVTSTYTLPGTSTPYMPTSTIAQPTDTTPIPTTASRTTMSSASVSTATHTVTESPLTHPNAANSPLLSNNFICITIMFLVATFIF